LKEAACGQFRLFW